MYVRTVEDRRRSLGVCAHKRRNAGVCTILHGLGLLFGHPLRTDNATLVGSHPTIALVLVVLDITKRYPDFVWIGPDNLGYVQSIVMEDFSSFFDDCKALGYDKKE
ncbi:hypothetical protein IEQ34_017026 [Dendrobium chrysotoxum]|uniref:Uncharacterized protein n=1 Tax=Dendrobium chrysotoxum TaxID=161865 RepID=A0AAV7GI02_DENCH|nr:hypothetical protein IEQ34_017026 [Dendrobium chrysotoxum]